MAAGVVLRYLLLETAHPPTKLSPPPRQGLNAPFITSPDLVVEKMVELACPTPSDLVYDLGCGDGRIVITAALKTGCRGVGFDIDPQRVAEARANVQLHEVADRVQIVEQDVFSVDLSRADVAMMYLLPWMMNKLLPQFAQMKPGCRIVSYEFWIDEIMPENIVETPAADGHIQRIYLYTTPLTKSPALEPGKPPVPSDLQSRSREVR
ncbi:MAG: methyltransferase domain-containing protein [Pirellulaceae bacterium]|nr:methyltransferase domain-containing protein [Pirellulaceae bacterium]